MSEMSNAHLCKCGHIKTDHKQERTTRQKTGACEWLDCDCKKFKFGKIIQTVYPPEIHPNNMVTLIDCRNNPTNKIHTLEDKKRSYSLSDCDTKGRAIHLKRGFHPKLFNNGEYP